MTDIESPSDAPARCPLCPHLHWPHCDEPWPANDPPFNCPAGGPHVWTDEVDETRSDRRSAFYLPPAERWHCEHCHATRSTKT